MPIRKASPTGAPIVGEPPIAVRTIGRLVERRKPDDDPLDLVTAMFPGLSSEDAQAAVDLALADPDGTSPRPDARTALGLALFVGLGTVVALACSLGLLALAFIAAARPATEDPELQERMRALSPGLLALVALPCIGGIAAGAGGLLLKPWSRFALAAIGGLAVLGAVAAATRGNLDDPALKMLPIYGPCLFLLPAFARWTTPEGRAAASATAVKAYSGAVAWSLLAFGGLLLANHFRSVFESMNVELPALTELVLNAGITVASFGALSALVPIAIVLAATPVLFVRPRLERRVTFAIHGSGLVIVPALILAIVRPILALQAALQR